MSSRNSSKMSTSSSHSHCYSKCGIGGAGNFHKTSVLLACPSIPQITPRTSGTFSTSIGGAGNVRDLSERLHLSSSAHLSREEAQRRAAAKNWHHGIGGAGNKTGVKDKRASMASFESWTVAQSNADRMRDGLAGIFGRGKRVSLMKDSSFESLALKN